MIQEIFTASIPLLVGIVIVGLAIWFTQDEP